MSIKKMKEEGCVHACVLEVRVVVEVVEVEGGVIPSWPTAGTPASERDGWLDLDTLHPHVK